MNMNLGALEGSVDSWGALYMKDFIQVDGFNVNVGVKTLFTPNELASNPKLAGAPIKVP